MLRRVTDIRMGIYDESSECNENVPVSSNVQKQIPVDHGWAWCVLLGATVNVMVLMIFLRATSLLFISFLDIYKASSTMTTLIFALSSVTFSTSNIVASTVLVRHFEVRSICLTGALANFFTIVGIAYAPNIIVMNVLFAVLGCSHGLIFVPQLTLLGRYFKKRLSLATATTSMGISLATIGGTPMTQTLLDTFGLRGTVLILAGITLHCVPASMLLRPTSYYSSAPTATPEESVKARDCGSESFLEKKKEEDSIALVEEQAVLINNNAGDDHETQNKRKHHKMSANMPQRRQRSVSESWHVQFQTKLNNVPHLRSSFQIDENLDGFKNFNSYLRDQAGITASVTNILSQSLRYLSDTSSLYGSSLTQNPDLYLRTTSARPGNENHKEAQQVLPDEEKESDKQLFKGIDNNNEKTFIRKLKDSAKKSVYTNPAALFLLLSSGLGIHTQAGINYMPATGMENGLTDKQISLLLTVLGVADILSKFAVGVLGDSGIIRRIHIACISQLITGVLFQFVVVFQGFPLMLVLQVVLGLCVGVFHVLLPVITVDFLGVQHMGHIVSGYMLINGVVNALDHVVVGSLRDLTGSLYGSYQYMGSLAIMSSAILLAQPLFQKCLSSEDA